MSIVTKTGDRGTTALMYNHRVAKSHPLVESCGAIDELNAALGLARATISTEAVLEQLLTIQRELVALMGELATLPEDLPRYEKDGFPRLTAQSTARLEKWVKELEADLPSPTDWVMPGKNAPAATLDLARTVCRRAERQICALQETGQLQNQEIIVFLNRLSDLLWLLARAEEKAKR